MSQTAESESTAVDVGFVPTAVSGHIIIDGRPSEELTTIELASDEEPQPAEQPWDGPLGFEGIATSDKRYLIPGEISQRDLPLPLNVQVETADGHDNSLNAGRIESIQHSGRRRESW